MFTVRKGLGAGANSSGFQVLHRPEPVLKNMLDRV
jgi:hypothetical protein